MDNEPNINSQELQGKLQAYQLELEMQNEQLSLSYQLIENERSKLAGFFDLAPVGYFVLDHLGVVEEANQMGADLLGVSKDKVLSKPLKGFINPSSFESFYVFLSCMKNDSEKQNCEIMVIESAANLMYLRLEGRAVRNSVSGKLQYYVTTIDITDNKLAQLRLISTTQRLEMTLSASGTGTWTMEVPGDILSMDDVCYSIFEINPLDFNGSLNAFIQLIHPEDQLSVREAFKHSITNFSSLDFEFRFISKSGDIKNLSVIGHQISKVNASFFAGIIMDTTDKKRLDKQATDLHNDKQRSVLSATFNAQEKERFKISNALHDSVCQILYGIRLNLQGIQISSDKKKELNDASLLLDEAIRETRAISYELTPSVLRDFGFVAGVKEMAQRMSSRAMKIYAHLDRNADLLDKEVQLYVFRVIQELISNSLKHTSASQTHIKVTTDTDHIMISVSDDGGGFKLPVEQAFSEGSGLKAIKDRIYLLGGSMDLETSGKGTVVSIKFRSSQSPMINN
ncbi:MAG: PAS domain-containing protein [Pedobacter sp.]